MEAAEVKKVADAVKEKEKWFNEKWNELNQQKPYEQPALLTSAIVQEKQVG